MTATSRPLLTFEAQLLDQLAELLVASDHALLQLLGPMISTVMFNCFKALAQVVVRAALVKASVSLATIGAGCPWARRCQWAG